MMDITTSLPISFHQQLLDSIFNYQTIGGLIYSCAVIKIQREGVNTINVVVMEEKCKLIELRKKCF